MSGAVEMNPAPEADRAFSAWRRRLEDAIERGIALLDMMDAAGIDREPDGEDEVVSEDDGMVVNLRQVGRQFGSHTG